MLWLFRLPPVVYLGVAPLGVIGAGYLFITDQQSESAKAAALAGKAPAAVTIEAFDPAKNVGAANEVTVLAQIDVSRVVDLSETKKGRERDHWVIAPLYPTNATDAGGQASGMMIQRGNATVEQLAKMAVGEGKIGPIVSLNGLSVDPSSESKAIDEVKDQITVKPGGVYIDPFEDGRAAGLAPSSDGKFAALAILIVSLLVGAFGAFGFQRARRGATAYREGTI
ncbi:hypothetical protein TPR58_22590 [Sphingomonas sp. HF-S3]|uniref:Uncharacterized protein n=1 Tax=Sphingomonas rustica TaxID=3103142 RepID=A0ABV0BEK8_9SPHN